MSEVRFVDNTDIILRKIGTNSKEAMDEIADMLVEAVQEKILYGYQDVHGDPPHTEIVETGRLFDSIDAEVTKESQNAYTTAVGANTPYVKYVHEGTYKLKGRRFISDAVTERVGDIKAILLDVLPDGIT